MSASSSAALEAPAATTTAILPSEWLGDAASATKQVSGHARHFVIYLVTDTCELLAECSNCTKHGLEEATQFAPKQGLKNARREARFAYALEQFEQAMQAQDAVAATAALKEFVATRRYRCSSCSLTNEALCPNQQACAYEYEAMVTRLLAKHPTCANCSESRRKVLDIDHVCRATKAADLSCSSYWAAHGGVAAMRREYEKGLRLLCRNCHATDPNSNSSLRGGKKRKRDEADEADEADETAKQRYDRERHARLVGDKQRYVDAEKRRRGCCADCGFKVAIGNEVAFDFDHRRSCEKLIGKNTLAGQMGGVAGIVNNHSRHALLDAPGVKETLDWQMRVCVLRCKNCHKLRTEQQQS